MDVGPPKVMPALPSPPPLILQGRPFALAFLLWLGTGTLVGLVAAFISGEHGSLFFVVEGLFVGMSGGFTHAALLALSSFRRRPALAQAVVVWLAAVALFILGATVMLSSLVEAASVVGRYLAGPALLVSAASSWLVGR